MADEIESFRSSSPKSGKEVSEEPVAENTYVIRPNYANKFKKALVKKIISSVVAEQLNGESYNEENVGMWTQNISNSIKEKTKELEFERYKIIVQCLIGEQRGEGAKMACRCFWDSDADNYAQEVFISPTLFCVTAVFGVYFY